MIIKKTMVIMASLMLTLSCNTEVRGGDHEGFHKAAKTNAIRSKQPTLQQSGSRSQVPSEIKTKTSLMKRKSISKKKPKSIPLKKSVSKKQPKLISKKNSISKTKPKTTERNFKNNKKLKSSNKTTINRYNVRNIGQNIRNRHPWWRPGHAAGWAAAGLTAAALTRSPVVVSPVYPVSYSTSYVPSIFDVPPANGDYFNDVPPANGDDQNSQAPVINSTIETNPNNETNVDPEVVNDVPPANGDDQNSQAPVINSTIEINAQNEPNIDPDAVMPEGVRN